MNESDDLNTWQKIKELLAWIAVALIVLNMLIGGSGTSYHGG
jgi:cytochrome b